MTMKATLKGCVLTMSNRILFLFVTLLFARAIVAQQNPSIQTPPAVTIKTVKKEVITPASVGLDFIDTSIENGSPLWYEIDTNGGVQIQLLYDHERSSPNRAAGHWHFLIHGRTGAKLTLTLNNLDNIWNGRPGNVAREQSMTMISTNGSDWEPIPIKQTPPGKLTMEIEMPGPQLYVARVEPYGLSNLANLIAKLKNDPLVEITSIGKTVEERNLEIIRLGKTNAPKRVFVRARSHPWEAGGNWVVEGLIQRFLQNDSEAQQFRERFCLYIMPMANKDGVAHGRTRFNLRGMDLNRNWNRPSDPLLSPENYALETWLNQMIKDGKAPHLALELHNDGGGQLHISRPNIPNIDQHIERMKRLEGLLRKHTWFTEGSTPPSFSNSGSMGEGWLERFGIDTVIHEFNATWIAGLKAYPQRQHWEQYGRQLCRVFYEYFEKY